MPTIRIRYKGKIHIREVTRNYRGWYIMVSRHKEYWFKKDNEYGWYIGNDATLPDEFVEQISEELKKLEQQEKI